MGFDEEPTHKEPAGADGENGSKGSDVDVGENYPYNTVTFHGAAQAESVTNYSVTVGTKIKAPTVDEHGVGVAYWEVTVAATNLPPQMGGEDSVVGLKKLKEHIGPGADIDTIGIYGDTELRKFLDICDDPAAANATKMYDGQPTNITVTVTNDVPNLKIFYSVDPENPNSWTEEKIPFTHVKIDSGSVSSNKVWYVLEADGYAPKTNFAWVTIQKRPVTLVSEDHTFTYTGEPQAWSNVTVKTGEKLYDFVRGEGVTTNNFATVTNVSDSGAENNTFGYALNDNTKPSNYDITLEYGDLAVVAAPIKPKEPGTGDEPPDHPTPENPGNVEPPTAGDGPTLWAPNVAKVYDGLPTNVVAQVYNAGDNTFGYLYTTNENHEAADVWSETLDLVNVLCDDEGNVASYKVYYCVTNNEGNLIGTNCFSYVTILPREVTVTADDKGKTYGDEDPELTATVSGVIGTDTIDYTVSREECEDIGEYPITPTGEEDQGNYLVKYVPGLFTISNIQTDAMLTAQLSRAYNAGTGSYYAQLKIACTNKYAENIGWVGYLFQDRGTVQHVQGEYGEYWKVDPEFMGLWDSIHSCPLDSLFNGRAGNRFYQLDAGKINDVGHPVGDWSVLEKHYGPVSPDPQWVETADRRGTMEMGVGVRRNPSDIASAQGWLVWESNGHTNMLELVSGQPAGETRSMTEDDVSGETGGSSASQNTETQSGEQDDDATGFRFAEDAAEVWEGSDIVIDVFGGDSKRGSSVQIQAIYNTLAKSDLNLKEVTLDGVPVKNFKFPFTISWSANQRGVKQIRIPVKTDKATAVPEADEFMTFQLLNPVNDEIGNGIMTVTVKDSTYHAYLEAIGAGTVTKAMSDAVAKAEKPYVGKVYVRALADNASYGKVSGSKLVKIGKTIVLRATPGKGCVFLGWYSADAAGSEPLSQSSRLTVTASDHNADYIAAFMRLPDYAIGTFTGPVFGADGSVIGVATLTAGARGKISGKLSMNCEVNGSTVAKKLSFKANSFASYDAASGAFTLQPTYKDGRQTRTLNLTLSAIGTDPTVGVISGEGLLLYQDVLKGVSAEAFVPPVLDGLDVKVKKDGILSIAGKDGGVSVSCKANIFYVPEIGTYKATYYFAAKKGYAGAAGVIEVDAH